MKVSDLTKKDGFLELHKPFDGIKRILRYLLKGCSNKSTTITGALKGILLTGGCKYVRVLGKNYFIGNPV